MRTGRGQLCPCHAPFTTIARKAQVLEPWDIRASHASAALASCAPSKSPVSRASVEYGILVVPVWDDIPTLGSKLKRVGIAVVPRGRKSSEVQELQPWESSRTPIVYGTSA